MHHISLSSLVVFGAICLLYALVVLAILQFCKVAKLKPNPPESSTVRVELTISARAPAGAYPDKSAGPSITTTFVFADEFATTVTDFLAGYHSPSRADFLNFLQQSDGLIADLLINRQYDTLVRSLTLLGKDAEDVTPLGIVMFIKLRLRQKHVVTRRAGQRKYDAGLLPYYARWDTLDASLLQNCLHFPS